LKIHLIDERLMRPKIKFFFIDFIFFKK